MIELLEAAEAKAYYGLAINWKPLEALSTALLERGVLQGKEVRGWGCLCWAELLCRAWLLQRWLGGLILCCCRVTAINNLSM